MQRNSSGSNCTADVGARDRHDAVPAVALDVLVEDVVDRGGEILRAGEHAAHVALLPVHVDDLARRADEHLPVEHVPGPGRVARQAAEGNVAVVALRPGRDLHHLGARDLDRDVQRVLARPVQPVALQRELVEAQQVASAPELLRLVDAAEHVVEVGPQARRGGVAVDADDPRLHHADRDRVTAQRHRVVGAIFADDAHGAVGNGPAHQNR
jgi:hypothetical protein